jgi:hypothetical protein
VSALDGIVTARPDGSAPQPTDERLYVVTPEHDGGRTKWECRWRGGPVVAGDRCVVLETDGEPYAVGLRQPDMATQAELDAARVQDRVTARAQAILTGGGTITWHTTSGLAWNQRFIAISAAARGTDWSSDGHFSINMPPNGTAIPVVNATAPGLTRTVAGGHVPLVGWSALYYELPVGSNNVTVNANFKIIEYDQAGAFAVPPHWVLVAVRNDDSLGGFIKLGTGQRLSTLYINSIRGSQAGMASDSSVTFPTAVVIQIPNTSTWTRPTPYLEFTSNLGDSWDIDTQCVCIADSNNWTRMQIRPIVTLTDGTTVLNGLETFGFSYRDAGSGIFGYNTLHGRAVWFNQHSSGTFRIRIEGIALTGFGWQLHADSGSHFGMRIRKLNDT